MGNNKSFLLEDRIKIIIASALCVEKDKVSEIIDYIKARTDAAVSR
jgi:hypothetical protein